MMAPVGVSEKQTKRFLSHVCWHSWSHLWLAYANILSLSLGDDTTTDCRVLSVSKSTLWNMKSTQILEQKNKITKHTNKEN